MRFSITVSLSLKRKFEEAAKGITDFTQGNPTREDRQHVGGIHGWL
ncbi:hypothetical protein [Prosthecobacter sp.]